MNPVKHKSKKRLLARIFLYAVAGIVVLGGVTYGVLNSAWFRQRLEREITQGLEGLTGGRVELNRFAFRPLVLQIRIGELVIHGTEPSGASPLFSAQRVEAEINPTALIHGHLVLRRLQWRSAEIHVTTNQQGEMNLPGPNISLLSKETMKDLLDLSIRDLVLAHTDLYWNNRQIPLDVAAKNAGLTLRATWGPRYLGTFACSVLSIKSTHWLLPSSALTGQFELARSGAKLTSVVWRAAGISGQGSLDFNLLEEPEAAATFQIKGEGRELAKYFSFGGIESGDIELAGQAEYRQGSWASSGRIRASSLQIKSSAVNLGRVDASTDYFFNAEKAEVTKLDISVLGGRIAGEVEGRLRSKPEFRSRLNIEGIGLSEALGAFPATQSLRRFSHLRGAIKGTSESTWSGEFEHLQSKFDLRLEPRGAGRGTTGSIPAAGVARGTATYDGSLYLNFAKATLETPRSQFEARGNVSNGAADLAVTFSTGDFEEWRPLVEHFAGVENPIPLRLESPASFTGKISGAASAREIQGQIQTGEFEFSNTHWNGFSAEILAGPENLKLTDGRMQAGASGVELQMETPLSHWAWAPSLPLHAQLRSEGAELKDLAASLGLNWQISGPLTANMSISGPASDFTGKGSIAIEHGTLGPVRFDSLRSGVSVGPAEFHLEDLRMTLGGGNVTGLASYNFSTQALTASLQGHDFSLAEINLPGATNREKPSTPLLGGLASFNVQGGGILPKLDLAAEWKVENFKLEGSPLGNLNGRLNWDGNSLRIAGGGQGAGGTFSVQGEAQTRGEWPLDLTGHFSNFEAGPWIRSFLNGRFNARLIAGGTFHLSGPLERPAEVQGSSRVESVEVHLADLAWSSAQPFELTYARERLTIGKFQMVGPSTAIEVAGSVMFSQPPSLDVSASGSADAKLLTLVDPKLEATGLSRLTLHVTGSPADPYVQGRLDVEGLSLSYGNLPFHVSDINGPIELQGDRATATALKGRSGGGTIALSGFATFNERPRFDVRASLEGVRIRYPFDFTSLLDGDLRLAGTPDGGRLSGDLQVRQMFAGESFNVLSLLSEGSTAFATTPEEVSSQLAANIRLGVEVASAPSVRLETHDLRLTYDLDMRLQGTLSRPVITGAVHILSGEALVRGNRYKLDRGDITMANPLRTDPILDLEATTRVEHYDLTLELTGPLDRIKIAYRSDPPLAVGDILSLLALGYVREETAMSTAQSGQLQSVGASALLSEALSNQMTGRLQRLFGVSRVKVDPNVIGPNNASGARITVEQEVTRDLTLTYITNTATSQQRIIQFEWALSDNISLVGVRDQNGIFGLELKFRRRFK